MSTSFLNIFCNLCNFFRFYAYFIHFYAFMHTHRPCKALFRSPPALLAGSWVKKVNGFRHSHNILRASLYSAFIGPILQIIGAAEISFLRPVASSAGYMKLNSIASPSTIVTTLSFLYLTPSTVSKNLRYTHF